MDTMRVMGYAIEAFRAGQRDIAGMAFARIVRAEPRNEAAWLWLSACVEQTDRRRACLERVLVLNPDHAEARRRLAALDSLPPEATAPKTTITLPADGLPVSMWAAGVKFDGRPAVVHRLRLRQPIMLRREPGNSHDPNAIRLEAPDGAQFGFVRKEVTPLVAPYMDRIGEPLTGVITELFSDLNGEHLRVGFAFSLPEAEFELEEALTRLQEGTPEIAWLYEPTDEATYVLIEGSEEDLRRARLGMQQDGITVLKYGMSFRPARDGCFYTWYLHLTDPHTEKGRIKACLEQRFTVRPSKADYEEAEALSRLFDSERADLQAEKEAMIQKVRWLESENARLRKSSPAANPSTGISSNVLRDALLEHAADDLSPEQILCLVQSLCGDGVEVLESALKAAREVEHYKRSKRLLELLWKLCTEYPALMRKGDGNRKACEDLFGGETYAAKDDASNDYYRKQRTFRYGENDIYMPEHLKIGVATDTSVTLRIHFKWLNDEGKIVIGYCGSHLPQQA